MGQQETCMDSGEIVVKEIPVNWNDIDEQSSEHGTSLNATMPSHQYGFL